MNRILLLPDPNNCDNQTLFKIYNGIISSIKAVCENNRTRYDKIANFVEVYKCYSEYLPDLSRKINSIELGTDILQYCYKKIVQIPVKPTTQKEQKMAHNSKKIQKPKVRKTDNPSHKNKEKNVLPNEDAFSSPTEPLLTAESITLINHLHNFYNSQGAFTQLQTPPKEGGIRIEITPFASEKNPDNNSPYR